jgi:thiamine biosynthesis lipoprotein
VATSELSRLNASRRPVRVSPDTFALVARAVDAWSRTEGRFDPTGLAALRDAGYDTDFATVAARADGECGARPHPAPTPLPGCRGIELDPIVRSVWLPEGVTLDLGGIGKGYAAGLLADGLVTSGASAVAVDLGGDVAVRGTGPYDGAWEVAFGDDAVASQFGRLRLAAGGVATSTTRRRRWRVAGESRHHLLDPRTGGPSRSGVASATVVAGDTWWAEVLAKAAVISGMEAGLALLTREGVAGVLVADDDRFVATADFAAWCVPAATVGALS